MALVDDAIMLRQPIIFSAYHSPRWIYDAQVDRLSAMSGGKEKFKQMSL
jgi:hypothetical protein